MSIHSRRAVGILAALVLGSAARTAEAGSVTYDFSIFIVPTDSRGENFGPWKGKTLTGHVTYDTTTQHAVGGLAIVFDVTDLALNLPSGTVLHAEDFPFARFALPFDISSNVRGAFIDGGTFAAAGCRLDHEPGECVTECAFIDPLDLTIFSMEFTVVNTAGAGFRYFDICSVPPNPFVNGYYGQVTYKLRIDSLIGSIGGISTNPADGQMTNSKQNVNKNWLSAVQMKLATIQKLIAAGDEEAARNELEALRLKVDCDPMPSDWFVCGSDAQVSLLLTIDELLRSIGP